jgi:hypothetical protein
VWTINDSSSINIKKNEACHQRIHNSFPNLGRAGVGFSDMRNLSELDTRLPVALHYILEGVKEFDGGVNLFAVDGDAFDVDA